MVFRRYFRFPRYFQLVAFIRMSSRLERPSAIYRSTSFSLPLSSLISITTSFRSVLFRWLFSVETRLHTLYHPQKPLDCEFPRWRKGTRGKFPHRGNKWTWSRNWFSCLAGIGFSLPLSNHFIVCRVYRDCKQSELDISRIDWNASI